MRTIHLLPLGAAILLAACGSSGDEAAGGGDEAVTAEAVAAKVEGMVQPRPGQYQTTLELIEFDVPGMPEQAKAQVRAMLGGELSQGNDFCLTPEEAENNGAQKMMENLAESNCTFDKFDVAGGKIDADMQCKGQDGMVSHVQMDGTMTAEGSAMTMTMDQDMANVGKMNMKMKVTSKRTGDCAA
jgi:hypothetical protein